MPLPATTSWPDKVAAAVARGVKACASPAEVARAADIVLMSLTTTAAVEEVVLGAGGIASAGRLEGKVLVDHSTTEIDTTKRVAAALTARSGMDFVDAPVSGGPGSSGERHARHHGRRRGGRPSRASGR